MGGCHRRAFSWQAGAVLIRSAAQVLFHLQVSRKNLTVKWILCRCSNSKCDWRVATRQSSTCRLVLATLGRGHWIITEYDARGSPAGGHALRGGHGFVIVQNEPVPSEHPSAVAVPVSDAEPIVSAWRQLFDSSAAQGMPAHVTALYPFLPPTQLAHEVLATLRDICATFPVIEVEFRSTSRFSNHLYLEPEPPAKLIALTEAINASWPETPPYGGVFDEIVPHLTVAQEGQVASEQQLAEIEADVLRRLPLRTRLTHACLYVSESGRWRTHTILPFTAQN